MRARTKKRLTLLSFKGASIAVSAGMPIWAILEKFPLWREEAGALQTLGIGGVMIVAVSVITFKKTVFNYLKEKTGMKSAPPLAIWAVLLFVSFALSALADAMSDMRTVFVAGIVGSGIGTALNFIGETLKARSTEESVATENE